MSQSQCPGRPNRARSAAGASLNRALQRVTMQFRLRSARSLLLAAACAMGLSAPARSIDLDTTISALGSTWGMSPSELETTPAYLLTRSQTVKILYKNHYEHMVAEVPTKVDSTPNVALFIPKVASTGGSLLVIQTAAASSTSHRGTFLLLSGNPAYPNPDDPQPPAERCQPTGHTRRICTLYTQRAGTCMMPGGETVACRAIRIATFDGRRWQWTTAWLCPVAPFATPCATRDRIWIECEEVPDPDEVDICGGWSRSLTLDPAGVLVGAP